MGNALPADELGQTGEDLFRRLCSQSRLTCNKSERDRAGWDFVVDLPVGDAAAASLDQRSAPACVVQLKSTTNSNPARLSLSAIERIAKDPRPAFVIVFRLTPDGREICGYLIHLIGPILARVLRRLRQAETMARFDIHKAVISLKPAGLGTRFALTPEGLRQAILDACGADHAGYIREKQHQLATLGYEDGGLQAEAMIWAETPEHLSRVLVGLEPMRPQQMRAFDVRFGMAVPYTGSALDDVEEMRIEPPSFGPCQVTVRGATLAPAAVFAAEAFVGPPLPIDGSVWVLVRHSEFTAAFVGDSVQFESQGNFAERQRTLGEWAPIVRALHHLASGKGSLSFLFGGKASAPLTLPMSERLNGPYLDQMPNLLRFIEGWTRLADMAGVLAIEPFSLKDLWAAAGVQVAADMMTNPNSTVVFAYDIDAFDAGEGPVEALYFNTCRLADAALSYCVKVRFERIEGEYRSAGFTPLDARPAVEDLLAYAETQADAAGIRVLIHPDNIVEVSPSETHVG